jgi:hypothetical protein
MRGPVAAAIPNWQASVSFINRSPGPRPSESGSGHFRQIETAVNGYPRRPSPLVKTSFDFDGALANCIWFSGA